MVLRIVHIDLVVTRESAALEANRYQHDIEQDSEDFTDVLLL